ncbi:MAG: VOC family protein [Microgenomates group bacterium]
MFDGYETFIDETLEKLASQGISVSGLVADHIARTTESSVEYDTLKPDLLKLGELVAEDLVGPRRVGIVRLKKPLHHGQIFIEGVELIEPAEGHPTPSAINHIEFVIPMGFGTFMANQPRTVKWDTSTMTREQYPHLKITDIPEVKFHEVTIFETVERQHLRKKEL